MLRPAARAMRALRDTNPRELATNPDEVYTVVDALMLVVADLWAVSARIGTQVRG